MLFSVTKMKTLSSQTVLYQPTQRKNYSYMLSMPRFLFNEKNKDSKIRNTNPLTRSLQIELNLARQMKKMTKIDRKLLSLPASGRRKAFKLSDPADAPSNALHTPSTTAFLVVSHALTFFASSLISSLYVNLKSFPKGLYPTFSMNLIISTVTSRSISLPVTIKTTK